MAFRVVLMLSSCVLIGLGIATVNTSDAGSPFGGFLILVGGVGIGWALFRSE